MIKIFEEKNKIKKKIEYKPAACNRYEVRVRQTLWNLDDHQAPKFRLH